MFGKRSLFLFYSFSNICDYKLYGVMYLIFLPSVLSFLSYTCQYCFLVSPLTLKQMHSYGCSYCLWMICYFNLIGFILSYCQIVPPTAHLVISSASDFLLKWLFQYEHEHQQWSAALSLGLVFNCFHPTDKKSRFQVINGLLEV